MKKIISLWQGMAPERKRIVKPALGIIAGGLLGYTYYMTVGCASGGCPITSNPIMSTFWGAAIGGTATAG